MTTKVTNVTVIKSTKQDSSTVAFGRVTLNKVIVIDHRIIQKKDGSGCFSKLGTDHKSAKDGKYYSDVYIDNAEEREAINNAIMEAYNNLD